MLCLLKHGALWMFNFPQPLSASLVLRDGGNYRPKHLEEAKLGNLAYIIPSPNTIISTLQTFYPGLGI